MIFFDARWNGNFGIGRYSSEVRQRIRGPVKDLLCTGEPLKPRGLANWENTARAARRHSTRGDVLFSPSFTPSRLWRGPQAITIHDLIHLDVASESSKTKQLYYRHVVLPAVRNNPVTFTVSEFSRQRIAEWSGVAEERIVVTGNAADSRFHPDGPKHDPGYPYVLYVRNAKPHKNSIALVQAFALLREPNLRLILSGQRDEATADAARAAGIEDRVVFSGVIAEAELPSFYRGAVAAAFPSLYEGFGIPAVEAMASGTPVIAANVTSLPEVCGEAAILVDPSSPDDIAAGLRTAIHDERTRAYLTAQGPRRAANFSWNNIAHTVESALDAMR